MTRWLWPILLSCALLVVGVAFLPSLLSKYWSFFYPVSGVEIASLHLNWWGNQRAEEWRMSDPEGNFTFTAEQVSCDAPLWQLLLYRNLAHLEWKSARLTIGVNGSPSKALAFFTQAAAQPLFCRSSFQDGSIEWLFPEDAVQIDAISGDILFFHGECKVDLTANSDGGKGHLSYLSTPSQLALDGTIDQMGSKNLTLLLSHLSPHLSCGVGDRIDAQFSLDTLSGKGFLRLNTNNLSTHLEMEMDQEKIFLSTPAHLDFNQELGENPLFCQNHFLGHLSVDQLQIPLKDPSKSSFQATVKSKGFILKNGWKIEPFQLLLASPQIGDRQFTFKWDSPQVQFNGQLYLPDQWNQLHCHVEGWGLGETRFDLSAETVSNLSVEVEGAFLHAHLSGGYETSSQQLWWDQPIEIGTPDTSDRSRKQLQLRIEPTLLSLAPLSGSIGATISVGGKKTVSTFTELSDRLCRISYGTDREEQSGTIGWEIRDQSIECTLSHLPTSLLQLFTDSDENYSSLAGAALDGSILFSFSDQLLQVDLKGDRWSTRFALERPDLLISPFSTPEKQSNLATPAFFQIALGEEENRLLSRWIPSLTRLATPLSAELKLLSFKGSRAASWAQFLERASYEASLQIKSLSKKRGSNSFKPDQESSPLEDSPLLSAFLAEESALFLNSSLKKGVTHLDLKFSSPSIRVAAQGALEKGIVYPKNRWMIEIVPAEISRATPLAPFPFLKTLLSGKKISVEIAPEEGFLHLSDLSNMETISRWKGLIQFSPISKTIYLISPEKKSLLRSLSSVPLEIAPLRFQIVDQMFSYGKTLILLEKRRPFWSYGTINLSSLESNIALELCADLFSSLLATNGTDLLFFEGRIDQPSYYERGEEKIAALLEEQTSNRFPFTLSQKSALKQLPTAH